jgi:hypothetical protein
LVFSYISSDSVLQLLAKYDELVELLDNIGGYGMHIHNFMFQILYEGGTFHKVISLHVCSVELKLTIICLEVTVSLFYSL